jgi:hypothetical protein
MYHVVITTIISVKRMPIYIYPIYNCPCQRHDGVGGRRGVVPYMRKIGTRWMWVANFTSWALYSGTEPRNSFNWRLGRPQNRSWLFWRRENILSQREFKPRTVQISVDCGSRWRVFGGGQQHGLSPCMQVTAHARKQIPLELRLGLYYRRVDLGVRTDTIGRTLNSEIIPVLITALFIETYHEKWGLFLTSN